MIGFVVATILTAFVAVVCQKTDLSCHICVSTTRGACYMDGKSTQVLPCSPNTSSTLLLVHHLLDYTLNEEPLPKSYHCGYFIYKDYYKVTEIVRSCFFAYRNTCEIIIQRGPGLSLTPLECFTCDLDYCNGTFY